MAQRTRSVLFATELKLLISLIFNDLPSECLKVDVFKSNAKQTYIVSSILLINHSICSCYTEY
jgi:hypothetical protein